MRFLIWLVRRLLFGGEGRELIQKTLALYRREGLRGFRRARAAAIEQLDLVEDYSRWLLRYDQPTPERRAAVAARIARLRRRPVISVLMPTYNSDAHWLTQAIESVRRQSYPHWELCVADDASTEPHVRRILEQYAQQDARIKVVFRARNGHISAASNSALDLVTGEWIALFDHDDLLAQDALAWVADAIERCPDCQMIYSDEDKIDARNRRSGPYFKPDWNPELFESQNMFSHLGVYRSDLIAAVGGFREGFEGAQDYDLALRCVERIDERQVHHIPQVLYHWRIHRASTAHSLKAKPYATDAGRRALAEHFARLGIATTVEVDESGYRVRYPLPASPPRASIIVVARHGDAALRRCIGSVRSKTRYANYEVLVVASGSNTPTPTAVIADSCLRILVCEGGADDAALLNQAARQAGGEVIVLLQDEAEVINADWLSEMVSVAIRPSIGAVGARLIQPNGLLAHAGIVLGMQANAGYVHRGLPRQSSGYFGRAHLLQAVSAISSACLAVRADVYRQVGGFSENFGPSEVDFCLKIREAGYRNLWTPYAELYLHESPSRHSSDVAEEGEWRAEQGGELRRRWGSLIENDPAYNPNLSLTHPDFRMAWPPRTEALGGSTVT